MQAIYIAPNQLNKLIQAIKSIEKVTEIKSLLFLMADNEKYPANILCPILGKITIPLIGGIFPELIFSNERKKSGVLLIPLAFELKTQLFDLSQAPENYIKQLEEVQKDSIDHSSALFVFTDAFSKNKEPFIQSLFNFFGLNPTYLGGGAGSLSFKPFPCIINNQGIHQNSAVIGWTKKKVAVGVAHGWTPISTPLKVTKCANNLLEELNWQPAFEVYRKIVEEHSKTKFTDDNFFDIAKSYPFGISVIDTEPIVRDPVNLIDNAILFFDSVKEGEYVGILHGNVDSLLEGASKARELAFSKIDMDKNSETAFCIDCISRVLFMQNDFKKELDTIGQDSQIVNGILSIGEIANAEDSFLEIYNKAIVVGLW